MSIRTVHIHEGDALTVLKTLEPESVNCCVTSPPYFQQRDYQCNGQIGLEETPEEFIDKLVAVFREVKRVLKADGTLWVNLGDSYASGGRGGGGSFMENRKDSSWQGQSRAKGWRSAPPGYKDKDLIGVPWMLAFALRADGWYLRNEIIWSKKNAPPEGARDRMTRSHEQIFLLSKSKTYFFDNEAIKEPASEGGKRNKRTVWTVGYEPSGVEHYATYPTKLIEPCIKAATLPGGVVLDPFSGSGTTGLVASRLGRSYIGIELNSEYAEASRKRIQCDMPLFNQVS